MAGKTVADKAKVVTPGVAKPKLVKKLGVHRRYVRLHRYHRHHIRIAEPLKMPMWTMPFDKPVKHVRNMPGRKHVRHVVKVRKALVKKAPTSTTSTAAPVKPTGTPVIGNAAPAAPAAAKPAPTAAAPAKSAPKAN